MRGHGTGHLRLNRPNNNWKLTGCRTTTRGSNLTGCWRWPEKGERMTQSEVAEWFWVIPQDGGDVLLKERRKDGSTRVLLEMWGCYHSSTNPSAETERLIAQTPHLLQLTQELSNAVAVFVSTYRQDLPEETRAELQKLIERARTTVNAAIHGPMVPSKEVKDAAGNQS